MTHYPESKKERIPIELQIGGQKYFGDATVDFLTSHNYSVNINFSSATPLSMTGDANDYNVLTWRTEDSNHPFKNNVQYIGSLIECQLIERGLITVFNQTIKLPWLNNKNGNFARADVSLYSNISTSSFIGYCDIRKDANGEYTGTLRTRFEVIPQDHLYYHYDGSSENMVLYDIIISQTPLSASAGFKIQLVEQ